jgi:glyoxylase-like metal-dependent hydrolase (beta-lactamase superfamily II)/rhodanese-related sulfurtransferase
MGAIVSFVDEGLGHSSYLVDLGDGRALVVDPPRLADPQRRAAAARDLEIAWTADTHSHADYVSGSPELEARGATFLAPRASRLEHAHRAVDPHEAVELTDTISLRAIPTPGHTPDHLAYLLCENGSPTALFSGGSLMVGTVGRTDLLGPEPREELARLLYRSLRDEILTLPDDLAVYPTHGAGSFCSAPGASDRTTTIGRERATNPLLQSPDEEQFVHDLLAGLGTFPPYFQRLPEVNRVGPRLYGTLPQLARLPLEAVRHELNAGAAIIDARPIRDFAAGHIPGSLSIQLRPVFASWLGWLVEPDRPLVFVLDDDQDSADLVRQCLAIGYERLAGELDGGFATWERAGLGTSSVTMSEPDAVEGAVLDVRQRAEYTAGHVPGAVGVELGMLAEADVPDGPLTLMCGHGERAMTAASVLERGGHANLRVVAGGPGDWAARTGGQLVTGT